MSLTKIFAQQSPAKIFGEMILVLILIGVADLLSGYQIRMLPLYAAPIFVVGWFCNRRLTLITAVFAGIVSLTADYLDSDPDLLGWIRIWEVLRHMGSCLAVGLVASILRAKHDMAETRIALLEHSQKLEREIVRISDAEHRRIGQDLHDGLCQYLAALGCSASSLSLDLEKLGLKTEANAASELTKLLEEAVVQTRELARGLVPAHVARIGLILALESLSQSVTRLQGINCTFEAKGRPRNYPDRTARNLYRIAQESINNATKHGKARNIAISLDASDELTTLRIEDDGAGFDESKVNGAGMGLSIMRYRARQSNGKLQVKPRKEGGTVVWCTARTPAES